MDDLLCTSADVKALAPIGGGYTGYDARITALIPVVSTQVQDFCHRTFVQAQYTEFFPTLRSTPYRLWVKESPVTGTPDVRVDYGRDWANATPLTVEDSPDGDYVYDADKGRFDIFAPLATHTRALRIVYTGGYAQDSQTGLISAPAAVVKATAMQVAFILKREVDQAEGRAEDATDKGRPYKMAADAVLGLLPDVQLALARFRRPLLGKLL